MHDSDWDTAAHIGRYKRNPMGSSRTIEIEFPRGVLSEFICYQEVSGEGEPQALLSQMVVENSETSKIYMRMQNLLNVGASVRGEDDAFATSDLEDSLEDLENNVT